MHKELELLDFIKGLEKEIYGEKYKDHLLEIYKLYVKMADNISERRHKTNNLFITINSAILGGIMYSFKTSNALFIILASLVGFAIAMLWRELINSYKRMNSGKFKVIHALENYLPVKPYTAEWKILKQGKHPKIYKPFTSYEVLIPKIFAFMYFVMAILMVAQIVYNIFL